MTGLSKEVPQGNIVAAMAWRVKYRVSENCNKFVPILWLGVHKQNRGSVYPAGLRCRALGESSVTRGYSKEEVNHAGVVVEERPLAAVAEPGYESMSAYNTTHSKADELLVTCFDDGSDVRYGTLSHSHMLLVLRAWLTKAKWDIPENTDLRLVFCDNLGQPSLSAVAAHGNAVELHAVLAEGVVVEVLN